MRAVTLPFDKATRFDERYALIRNRNFADFWREVIERRHFSQGHFSDYFKDLVQSMLCEDPTQRPTID